MGILTNLEDPCLHTTFNVKFSLTQLYEKKIPFNRDSSIMAQT